MKIVLAGPFETASLAPVLGDVSSLPRSGARTPVNALALEFVRQGHEVCLITLDPAAAERTTIKRNGLEVVFLPKRKLVRALAFSLFADEIDALTREYRAAAPDIVHAHWTYEFAEAGIRAGLPLVVTAHDSAWDVLWSYRDAYRFFRLIMALRALPRTPNLTVVGIYMPMHMRFMGYWRKIHFVPNGIDLLEWPYGPKEPDSLMPVITAVGSGDRGKNIAAAVSAFELIRQRLPRAELHLFGPCLERYEGIANVFVHGVVSNSDLRDFHLRKTAILVQPSLKESFGVVIVEARALGIPVVAGARSGGTPFVMGDVGHGLVDVRNPRAIASEVLKILCDPEIYRDISRAGRADIERRFAVDKVARQYLDIYDQVRGKI